MTGLALLYLCLSLFAQITTEALVEGMKKGLLQNFAFCNSPFFAETLPVFGYFVGFLPFPLFVHALFAQKEKVSSYVLHN